MKASIIIPNFNGNSLLERSLPAVVTAGENPANAISEIIVVDDGSTDGSVAYVKKNFPGIKVVKHTQNRGFSAAVNTGVRTSAGDLVVLLNTDVIPEVDFLISALKHFSDPKVFAVSLHEKGYGWARGNFSGGFIQLAKGQESEKFHSSFFVSGGSGVFRRKQWIELGGMDEKLFTPFYWEDIDLCYRAAKRGLSLGWDPDAKVTHEHESTIGKLSQRYISRIKERNQLLCLWKNITSQNLMRKHLVGVIKRAIRHPGYLRIVFMALGKLGAVLGKRAKEIKESKVSDEAIFARF